MGYHGLILIIACIICLRVKKCLLLGILKALRKVCFVGDDPTAHEVLTDVSPENPAFVEAWQLTGSGWRVLGHMSLSLLFLGRCLDQKGTLKVMRLGFGVLSWICSNYCFRFKINQKIQS